MDAFYIRYFADTELTNVPLQAIAPPAVIAGRSFEQLQSQHADALRRLRSHWEVYDHASGAIVALDQNILNWSPSQHLRTESSPSDGGSDTDEGTSYESEDC